MWLGSGGRSSIKGFMIAIGSRWARALKVIWVSEVVTSCIVISVVVSVAVVAVVSCTISQPPSRLLRVEAWSISIVITMRVSTRLGRLVARSSSQTWATTTILVVRGVMCVHHRRPFSVIERTTVERLMSPTR
jgi:K+ transporter